MRLKRPVSPQFPSLDLSVSGAERKHCPLEAAGAECHLSRQVVPAGAESAIGGVRTGTAEQQPLLLQPTATPPRAVGRKQVVDFLLCAGAVQAESERGGRWVM